MNKKNRVSPPQVSVIIPTHNRAEFLATAIRSVLKQTFKDFELLVIDDASSDTTAQVVASFRDPRIHYIRHDRNQGGAAARNTGIANSNGEYIAFLDDDDEWYSEKLMRQMRCMVASRPEVAVVYTGYQIVDRATNQVRARMIPAERGNLHAQLLETNPIGGTSSVLLKRECLTKVGLFDEALPSFQDRDLWIRIARAFEFDYVADVLLNYFVHGKKVWTNLDALLKGLEIMLAKHGSSAAFRRQCSRRYYELGIRFCDGGRIADGRRALLKSIGLCPYRIKPYVCFLLTLLGAKPFTMTRESQARTLTT